MYGQGEVDSLISLFNETEEVEQQLRVLNQIIHYAAFTDNELAEQYAIIHDSLAYTTEDTYYHGQAQSLLGRVYFASEKYGKCTEHFLEALKIAEQRKDTAKIATMSNNLSAVFWTQKDTINTIAYNKKALQYYAYASNAFKLGIGNLNLGSIYFDIAQYDSAAVYVQKSIDYYKLANRPAALSRPFYMLAKLSALNKQLNTALDHVEKAKQYIDESKQPKELADIHIWEGEIYTELNDFAKAQSSFDKAEQLIEKYGLKSSRTNLELHLADFYESRGNYKLAYEKLKVHHRLKEEAINAETDLEINELKTKYETEKMEAEVARLSLEDQLNQSRITNQRYALFGALFGLSLLSLLAFRLFRQKKKIRLQNQLISKALNEKDLLSSLKSLLIADLPQCAVEVIVIINNALNAEDKIKEQNQKTFEVAQKWSKEHSSIKRMFHILYYDELPDKKAGVGLARKIGMDQAAFRLEAVACPDGIITGFDADSSRLHHFFNYSFLTFSA